MAQKTLVKKNGLVRPLVTTPSNGPVRKLVTRCLSELIKHQWETNCKLRLPRFRARACASGPKIVKISDSDSVTIGFLVSPVLSIHMDRTSPGKMLASLVTLHQGAPSRCIPSSFDFLSSGQHILRCPRVR